MFAECKTEVDIHPCGDFDEAFVLTANPLYRYDLIISDTYRGSFANRDAQVLKMIRNYRDTRFCPLVVYSSGPKPADLTETAFVIWADKGKSQDIERAIKQVLSTNIPQLARKLQEELDRSAGSYLWGFLERNWEYLKKHSSVDVLERLIRRRASMQIGRLAPDGEEVQKIEGLEFYLYPPISRDFRLGDVIKTKTDGNIFVLLTPHCHLTIQPKEDTPRADYVLAVKTFNFDEIIKKTSTIDSIFKNPWKGSPEEVKEKLRKRTQSPAQLGQPNGRYWFLPSFLEIPEMYCDFLQVVSIEYNCLTNDYTRIATLDTPFAEALQSCFTCFYSSIGFSNLNYEKYSYLIERTTPKQS